MNLVALDYCCFDKWSTTASPRAGEVEYGQPSLDRRVSMRIKLCLAAVFAIAVASPAVAQLRADLDGDGIAEKIGELSPERLDIYVVMWKSPAPPIPWTDGSPADVCEATAFTIWSYWQETSEEIFSKKEKASIIGHAAVFAVYIDPEGQRKSLAFSNTGGDVGFYRRNHANFPSHPPYKATALLPPPIVACFRVDEAIAGHKRDGHWESMREFRARVRQRAAPRVQKQTHRGLAAAMVAKKLGRIFADTSRRQPGAGGPADYGLNTLAVRRLDSFDNPLPMRRYRWIPSPNAPAPLQEMYGGCANAVAAVLANSIAGEGLIPRGAKIERELSLKAFQGATVPIVFGDEAFDAKTGTARDIDLVSELAKLPAEWGKGDRVVFYDPNYWYREIPPNPKLVNEFRAAVLGQ